MDCELEAEAILECVKIATEMDSDDSDKEDVLNGLLEAHEMVLNETKAKRQWVKPWRKKRIVKGSFAFLKNELLLNDATSFQNYLRMNVTQFNIILDLIKLDIQRSDTLMRNAIPAEEKLAATLRFLATGESFQSLNYQSRLSCSFISKTVPEVCKAIWKHLNGTYLKFPNSSNEWKAIAMEFAIKWQFPNCLGALDGKHVNFRSPRSKGAFYHNYKGTNSIILMALVDANLRFICVDVGCNGRTNDAGVLQRSELRKVLDDESQLPQDSPVGSSGCLPYVIVADDAFPLQRHIMKPYPYQTKNPQKQIFNIRLSRARHVVEHAFGVLSNRFRIFQTSMNMKVETVTLACCLLHNFLIAEDNSYVGRYKPPNVEQLSTSQLSDAPYNPRRGEAENIRQKYMKYFSEDGKLDWQYDK